LIRPAALAISGLIVGAGLTGCSAAGVDATCDVDGVTDEVHHILSDSDGEMGDLLTLNCADDWAVASVAVTRASGDQAESFVFRGSDIGWILTSPVDACAADGPLAAPAALQDEVCALTDPVDPA